jgi:hypothetical protein
MKKSADGLCRFWFIGRASALSLMMHWQRFTMTSGLQYHKLYVLIFLKAKETPVKDVFSSVQTMLGGSLMEFSVEALTKKACSGRLH